jgi:hypothetical protein
MTKGHSLAYCADGMRYWAGVSANALPPIVKLRLLVGFLVNLARPVDESVLPPAAERNLLYAEVGM